MLGTVSHKKYRLGRHAGQIVLERISFSTYGIAFLKTVSTSCCMLCLRRQFPARPMRSCCFVNQLTSIFFKYLNYVSIFSLPLSLGTSSTMHCSLIMFYSVYVAIDIDLQVYIVDKERALLSYTDI